MASRERPLHETATTLSNQTRIDGAGGGLSPEIRPFTNNATPVNQSPPPTMPNTAGSAGSTRQSTNSGK